MEKINSISVWALIVNYNTVDECLELFENLKLVKGFDLHVLIIDNASCNADQQKLKEQIPIGNLIFNNANLGYAAANNIGIKKALQEEADYIWILNPDIRIEENTLKGMVKAIEKWPQTAASGVRILKRENPDYIFSDGEKLNINEGCKTSHKNHNYLKKECLAEVSYDIDYIDGSCVLLSVAGIKELGYLPEEYFLYFEETDWCFNAKRRGWKLVVNTTVNAYNHTSKKGKVFNYYYNRNKLLFCKKYNLNYNSVRNSEITDIFNEILGRVRGNYFKPYFKSRIKGLIAGIFKAEFYS